MKVNKISGAMYGNMIALGAERLYRNKNEINDLNVFPIPDGDTGDNMYMTVSAGAEHTGGKEAESLGGVAAAASEEMLLGARGNSGVILSRIFSGMSKGFATLDEADAAALTGALELGVSEAYHAVPVPVEGTILTVFSDGVRYAASMTENFDGIGEYFDGMIEEMKKSLERTPDLLPALADAGVVDSGGAGLICIFEGMRDALYGKVASDAPEKKAPSADGKKLDFSLFGEDDVLKYGYCTEFLLRLQNSKINVAEFDINELTDYLGSVGESVVAFADGSIVKVHVHTMTPGDILNHCQKYGEFLTLKIENMLLQHNEAAQFRPESAAGGAGDASAVKPSASTGEHAAHGLKIRKKYALVAVAAGEGLKDTFRSLGVDEVIDGGQSMNPSTYDFVSAFKRLDAQTIFVFPNNGNVIMTARQAAELYRDSDIRVIESHTVGEGYSAVSMFDFSDGDADRACAEAKEIISGVVTGCVARASREAQVDGVVIHEKDYIGFSGDTVYVDDGDREAAAAGLAQKLDAGSFGVLLLLVGEGPQANEANKLYAALQKNFPDTEVIMIDGGQPIYDYILVLE